MYKNPIVILALSLLFVLLPLAAFALEGVDAGLSDCQTKCQSAGYSEKECSSMCLVAESAAVRPSEPRSFADLCLAECMSKGVSEEICKAGCVEPEEATDLCLAECGARGLTEALCAQLCDAAKQKILDIKDCYDSCIEARPVMECEKECFAEVRELAEEVISGKAVVTVSENAVAITSDGRSIEIRAEPIEIVKVNETNILKVPVNLSAGERLQNFTDPETGTVIEGDTVEIPLKSESGYVNARLIADTKGVIGIAGSGQAVIESSMIDVEEHEGVYAEKVEDAEQYKPPAISIDIGLKDIPINASITVKDAALTNEELARFSNIPALQDPEKGKVVLTEITTFEISKKNIINAEHVDNATVRIKVDKKAVEGKLERIVVVRKDEGDYEILGSGTRLISRSEEAGAYIFEVASQHGLSLYALMTVEYMSPAEAEEKKLPIEMVLIGAAAIILVAIGAVFFLGKKPTAPAGRRKKK